MSIGVCILYVIYYILYYIYYLCNILLYVVVDGVFGGYLEAVEVDN